MEASANQPVMPNEPPAAAAYSRKNPFPGRMLVNRRLNSPDSEKNTRHFEISLAGSGITYEVGDSMAVYPTNDPLLVDEILKAIGATGAEEIAGNRGVQTTVREGLLSDYSITQPTPKFLKAIAQRASAAPLLNELLEPERKHDLATYVWGLEVIDFLLEHPSIKWTPQEFAALLPKLQPRLYSIASSLKAHPDAVHFIIDVVTYRSHGRVRKGICSSFLAERCADSPAPIYPTASKFRLPEENDAPIIMVGPGTGVAPFRAFLQERQATGARGRNWLFFGAQREQSDYFYKEDFDRFSADGLLTRIDTAFSRDQAHKIYVQDRMLEASGEIWKWLEEGAHFYICGDAMRMAKDVDATLRQIVQQEGGKDPEEANQYVEQLKNEKRYKRDVY
ncbi:MAG: sulfite reductase subunit alpha [Verrucomicrobiota bacterium]|nr:sulfite reductase subunit alpha [Verrucomicrobiota bacterium]